MADEPQDDKTKSFVALLAGTLVSHYRIINKIGAGGMGDVYLAQDTQLDRKVALKFLPPHLCADEDCRKRFKREAQAAAKLDHPNIISVYDVSEFQGRPHFAMAYVEGKSLREFAAGRDLSMDQILELAIQICSGLHAAHENGVTHRDVKPSNILIDTHGRARIVDFGLASVRDADQLTKTGSTLGTVGYMSPEQVQGKEVDHRSDLFSLGVVLYELITKQNPFKRDSEAATLKAVSDDHPEPLARFKRDIPDGMQGIIDKALEKDVQTRYQHADDLCSDLKRLIRTSDTRTAVPAGNAKWRKYKYWLAASLAVVAIAVILTLGPWKLETSSTNEAVATENRIAIMYFDNMTDPGDSTRLGEIITNLLITDLSESKYVRVMSSQRLYDILKQLGREGQKKIDRDVASEVARKANCRLMLMGTVLQTAPTFVVTSQLIDVGDGTTVASQRVESEAGATVFVLVDSLTVEIRNDLSLPEGAAGDGDRSVAQVTTSSREAYRYYLEGLELENKLIYGEAAEKYLKAIAIDSTFAMALCRLGNLGYHSPAEEKNWLETAVRYANKVTRRERLQIIATYDEFLGKTESALNAYKEIVTSYPDDKEARFWLGFQYSLTGQADSGITLLEQVVELDPFYKSAYNWLTYLYDGRGDYEKSIWAVNQYIRLAPDEPNPYDTRGDIYAFNGKLLEAERSYRQALEIEPGFQVSIRHLGMIFAQQRLYDSASAYFEKEMTFGGSTDRTIGRWDKCAILMLQGRFRQALSKLSEAIELDEPGAAIVGSYEAWQGYLYAELKLLDSAVAKIERGSKIAGDVLGGRWQGQVSCFLVQSLVNAGAIKEAQRVFENQSVQTDEWTDRYFRAMARAALEYGHGNFETAVGIIDSLIPQQPKRNTWVHFRFWYLKGRCFLETGKYDQAIESFEKIRTVYGQGRFYMPLESVKLHYYLGRAYEASNQPDEAAVQYEDFLEWWKDADPGIELVDDARRRFADIKNTI